MVTLRAVLDSPVLSFEPYIRQWQLVPDGEALVTHSSHLLPVRYQGVPAMLKVALEAEERRGGGLMVWWQGKGAVRVLAHDNRALLLERIEGERSLGEMAQQGQDDEATRILCDVAATVHAPRERPFPELVPLDMWFKDLETAALKHGGTFLEAAQVAQELLAAPQEVRILHGDLHHGNVLDAGSRGWLAIDPKGLLGERGFDFANIFCNPTLEHATAPGRLSRQASIVAERANLNRNRLLKWIVAYSGLAAAWWLSDEMTIYANSTLAVASVALRELEKSR